MNVNNKGQWNYKGGFNPVLKSVNAATFYAPHARTLRDTLTVQTGRKAVLRFCEIGVHLGAAVTTEGLLKVEIVLNKKGNGETHVITLNDYTAALIIGHDIDIDAEIPLDSGDSIEVYTESLAVGGTVLFHHFVNMIELDY